MDRPGKASAFKFHIISHQELIELITFALHCDSYGFAAEAPWQHPFASPKGGSFSMQAADLYFFAELGAAGCMQSELWALGICMHRTADMGARIAYPSALSPMPFIKLGPHYEPLCLPTSLPC